MKNLSVYHFTNKLSLKQILRDGAILPSPGFSEWEKPVVWLSSNSQWDNSASTITKTSGGEFRKRSLYEVKNLGMARISIDLSSVRVFTVAQFKNISRISTRNMKRLFEFALECNSDINEWRVCFSPISKESWEKVEVFDEKTKKWTECIPAKIDYSELYQNLIEIRHLVDFMSSGQKSQLFHSLEDIKTFMDKL